MNQHCLHTFFTISQGPGRQKRKKKKKSTKRIICVVLSTNFLIYSSVSPNPVSLIRYHRTKWHYQNPSPNKIQPSKPVFAHGMWWVQQRCKTDFVWAAFHGQSQDLAWLFGLRWECSVRGNAYVMWQPYLFAVFLSSSHFSCKCCLRQLSDMETPCVGHSLLSCPALYDWCHLE